MFYEEKKIKSLIICSKCNQRLDEPRVLPCGDVACFSCIASIQVINKKFDCFLCNNKHNMPDEGLPINKRLLALISMQPIGVYRGQAVEVLNENLDDMQKKITCLKFSLNNGIDKIKEFCIDLRSSVQMATEQAIEQLNEQSDELLNEINKFEKDCTKSYQTNEKTNEDALKTVKELELFLEKWNQYLEQPKISDKEILIANEEAILLKKKSEQELLNLSQQIFCGNSLKFIKNSNKLEKTVLGSLKFEKIRYFDSVILSNQQQQIQLLRLCEFPFDQNWKLIYRATRDGFKASDFHNKCDKKSNTFIIVKSASGNVFGGYTQQDWSHKDENGSSKSDPNAFIFSFINKESKPLLMKCQDPDRAVYCHNDYGPLFGYGNSIRILSESNLTEGNYSELGYTYKHPEYVLGSIKARSFLAGSYYFKTTQIEVFSLV